MPWIIGIDEAGYGPNLGPFVTTSVAVRLPNEAGHTDLWRVLASSVRRYSDPADDRIVVADLETAVLATLRSVHETPPVRLADYIELVAPDTQAELRDEPWWAKSPAWPNSSTTKHGRRQSPLTSQPCPLDAGQRARRTEGASDAPQGRSAFTSGVY